MSSGPLPSRVDFRKLAEQRASLVGSMPVSSFPRLKGLLSADSGEIAVSLNFQPGKGRNPRVTGSCAGSVEMLCQNCLDPVTVEVDVDIDLYIVANVDQLIELEPDENGLVCEGALVRVADIIEDELIVNLPMIPRHAEGECGETRRPESDDTGDEADTYRPFAGLEALKKDLKRSE